MWRKGRHGGAGRVAQGGLERSRALWRRWKWPRRVWRSEARCCDRPKREAARGNVGLGVRSREREGMSQRLASRGRRGKQGATSGQKLGPVAEIEKEGDSLTRVGQLPLHRTAVAWTWQLNLAGRKGRQWHYNKDINVLRQRRKTSVWLHQWYLATHVHDDVVWQRGATLIIWMMDLFRAVGCTTERTQQPRIRAWAR